MLHEILQDKLEGSEALTKTQASKVMQEIERIERRSPKSKRAKILQNQLDECLIKPSKPKHGRP